MKEQEWLECRWAYQLIWGGRTFKMSSRKLRLLACACCRRVWRLLAAPDQLAIEVAERFADGRANERELHATRPAQGPDGLNAAFFATAPKRNFRRCAMDALQQVVRLAEREDPQHDENVAQCSLVRDVFSNPFRPVLLNHAQRTPDVVQLACAAYDERALPGGTLDPARLTILADALEEASCPDAAILGHLREPGPHVLGCWVLDLCLGKP